MDWARDNAFLSHDSSAGRVFKFEQRPSTVVKIVERNQYRAEVWTLETHDQWLQWIEEFVSYDERGLLLILAKRVHGMAITNTGCQPLSISDWLACASCEASSPIEIRRAQALAPLADGPSESERPLGQRGIRNLPFSRNTFELLSEKMRVHESITRVISRSNVPIFSADSLVMADGRFSKQPAYVYNCRTPNSWDMDLALSETYYPHSGLNLAILYGCELSTEIQVLKRLRFVSEEAAHPLIMPGILAELELARHIPLVETNIAKVEGKIFELNFECTDSKYRRKGDTQRRNFSKRSAWLDLTYLRNMLITWNVQLLKMANHVDDLNENVWQSKYLEVPDDSSNVIDTKPLNRIDSERTRLSRQEGDIGTNEEVSSVKAMLVNESLHDSPIDGFFESVAETMGKTKDDRDEEETKPSSFAPKRDMRYDSIHLAHMMEVGYKIKHRLSALRDEYDEKIRDCTMRLDGMAMATQWSHSETNVEIALATNRDSRVMKSISLVTMVFLPGTFFATVFSMTFFDWSGTSKGTTVSRYLWIYVVITVVFTSITIALWYFLVIYRRKYRAEKEVEGGDLA